MKLGKEDRAGLYLTAIIHLALLIILLATSLGFSLKRENTFVLDFTKLEELERLQAEADRLQKEVEMREAISRKLQEEIGSDPVYRNVAVDRGALKDDRGTDAKQLYKDAERLAKDLKQGFEVDDDEDAIAEKTSRQEDKKEEAKYTGPSVVSYFLEGRKASKLSIPAYRCLGAGEVTVLITVDNAGNVTSAKVDENCSSTDACLRSFAIRAARLSRFSASTTASHRQEGNIVYRFIEQY